MNKADIKQNVRNFIAAQFLPGEDPSTITEQTRLVSDGVVDSLASLKLVSYLEEQFGITVEAHEVDVEHLDRLDSIADLVVSKLR